MAAAIDSNGHPVSQEKKHMSKYNKTFIEGSQCHKAFHYTTCVDYFCIVIFLTPITMLCFCLVFTVQELQYNCLALVGPVLFEKKIWGGRAKILKMNVLLKCTLIIVAILFWSPPIWLKELHVVFIFMMK